MPYVTGYLSFFGLQTVRVEVPDHAVGPDAVGRRGVAFGQWAAVSHLPEKTVCQGFRLKEAR